MQQYHPDLMIALICFAGARLINGMKFPELVAATLLKSNTPNLNCFMTTDYDQQALDWLSKHEIEIRLELSNTKSPLWQDDLKHNHYKVTLRKKNEPKKPRLTFDFWDSHYNTVNGAHPSDYDILSCISSDANCPEKFEDFCGEYGYNEDSRKAEQTFKACRTFADKLNRFLTSEEIESLQNIR